MKYTLVEVLSELCSTSSFMIHTCFLSLSLSLSAYEGEKACSGTVPVEALVDAEAKVNQMYWRGYAALLLAEVILGFCLELVYHLHARTGVNFKDKQGSVLCRC